MQQYDIDSLVESFASHSKKVDEAHEVAKQRREEQGQDPFPEDLSFNLSRALLSMCKEIQDLKAKLKS